jgi:uncharacterized protein with ParB-like and HNH nuclease domain
MSYIRADEKTVRELLKERKYSIDEYQREYAWETKHIEELIDDLYGRFWSCYQPHHARDQVASYDAYYLGAVILSSRNGTDYIVDGQQRLTSLTLLLIYLHHLQRELSVQTPTSVEELICSEQFGKRSYNLNLAEREECLRRLMETGEPYAPTEPDESVANMLARYADIQEKFPEDLKKKEILPFFVDWLMWRVILVQISTDSDDDAYIIFETMNDRGKSLTPTDMLKGYLLSQLSDPSQRTKLNSTWREWLLRLTAESHEGGSDFIKHWLRARYAQSIRERSKDAKPRDFDLIGTVFHRWVRDNRALVGLDRPEDYQRFLGETFPKYAQEYLRIREAERTLKPGWEAIYYNAHNNFTLQYLLLLAPIVPDDDAQTAQRKMNIVATYIDIWIARRAVNYRTLAYSSISYTMFNLAKRVRDRSVPELVELLEEDLIDSGVGFDGDEERQGVLGFGLNQWSKRYIHHILARLTAFVEVGSGLPNRFEEYVNRHQGKPYEIEHLWADNYDLHDHEYQHPEDFARARDRIGGLVLLPRGFNQSYGAAPYEKKLKHYVGQNLLAKSLHPDCYDHNPSFLGFVERTGLPFRPHPHFEPQDLEERVELYRRLCELVWSPNRLREAASG